MKTWCQQQGIPFLEVRSTMTTTQVNGSNTDTVPVADYVRVDSTHLSAKGAKKMGELELALFSTLFTRAADFDETATGNLVTNPLFNGTGGTVNASFAAGSVAPDNTSVSRIGSTAAVTSAIIVKNGRRWVEFSIDRSTMPDATTQEAVALNIATSGLSTTTYSSGRLRIEVDAGDGWRGTANANGIGSSWGFIPMNDDGSGVTDSTASMEAMGGIGYAGSLKTQPAIAGSATATFSIRTPSFRKGDGTVLKVRFAAPEVRAHVDPHLLMYNEADTAAPTLTSSASLTVSEEQAFSTQIVTSKPVKLSLSGTDASLFSINNSGLLKMRATPDFETPTDADADNVYSFNVVLTSFNPAVAAVPVPVTLTITDIADGSVYRMTGTNGTDLADLYSGVVRTGTTGGLYVSSNTIKNDNSKGGGNYLFPAEATGGNTEVRWLAASGASSGPGIVVRRGPVGDTSGGVSIAFVSNQIAVYRSKAGLSQATVNLDWYTTPSTGTAGSRNFIAQIINNVLRIYQNGVELTAAAGIDCTGCGEGQNLSGLTNSTASGNVGTVDDLNIRPAMARTSRIILKALTLTSDQLVANTAYAGTIANYTGTPDMTVTSDASGLFFVDGFNLRTSDPLGSSGTSYLHDCTDGGIDSKADTKLDRIVVEKVGHFSYRAWAHGEAGTLVSINPGKGHVQLAAATTDWHIAKLVAVGSAPLVVIDSKGKGGRIVIDACDLTGWSGKALVGGVVESATVTLGKSCAAK